MSQLILGTTEFKFPDKYMDIVAVSKTVTISGNTDVSINFSTEISDAGVNINDVIGGLVYGYSPSSSWTTHLIVRNQNGPTVFNVRTEGSTNQNYVVYARFFYWQYATDL